MENLKFFDYTKEIYYYNTLEQFLNNTDNEIYTISNYIICNGKIFVENVINLCACINNKITKATFKRDMTKKLKEDNLYIRRINTTDKKVCELYNIDQFLKCI